MGMRRGVWVVLCWLACALFLAPAVAQADRAFTARFSANTQGDIAIAANSIESCLDALAACAAVRNGTGSGLNNNDRTMTWIDADGDPATFDSSASVLTLPTGASVLFAGLYYGGRLAAGNGGSPAPSPGARNTVRFKAPGDTAYRSLTASQVDDASTQYQGFVNVTSIVSAAGAGNYWTANVQVGTGLSDSGSGGWALVVAYGDPAAPSRNLSVFDGMQAVGSTSVTIPLSGFQTPLSGPVTSTVGLVAYREIWGPPATARRSRVGRAPSPRCRMPSTRDHQRPPRRTRTSSTRRSPITGRWSRRAPRASRTTSATTRTCSERRTCSATRRRAPRSGCRPAATPTNRAW
jgi:hypothetical protein